MVHVQYEKLIAEDSDSVAKFVEGVQKGLSEHGIGWHDAAKVEKSVDNVYIMYNIPEERHLASYTEVFTNEFIHSDIVPATWPF